MNISKHRVLVEKQSIGAEPEFLKLCMLMVDKVHALSHQQKQTIVVDDKACTIAAWHSICYCLHHRAEHEHARHAGGTARQVCKVALHRTLVPTHLC